MAVLIDRQTYTDKLLVHYGYLQDIFNGIRLNTDPDYVASKRWLADNLKPEFIGDII